jgi:hypothetical protein
MSVYLTVLPAAIALPGFMASPCSIFQPISLYSIGPASSSSRFIRKSVS